ncbi:MAG TPA: Hsp20/alpha crystallin family protein [Kiritimatiellia bacterium]|nr:Hsp20/alpha crystallin family protein [Kiritimatiellia bacterium]HRZ13161.1 Hsp20/alpha crystallin family protein [Kiritimatiellia bacterium]HSA17582.1 Hsp20/alpha crystallin family protein [Kiritimatiellia bacterium]
MTRNILVQWAQIQRKLTGLSDHTLEPHGAGTWSPNTDVYESADDVVIKMELAGVPAESVHIVLENRVVRVEGLRRDPQSGESAAGYRFRQMEIEYGVFSRTIELPFAVDGGQARARMQNGVLSVRLPRAREADGHRITVTTENQP